MPAPIPPRPPRRSPPPPPQRRRLVDLSMPLPWIIGMFCSLVSGLLYIGWMAANQSNKLTQVVESQAKIEAKQQENAIRSENLRDQFNVFKNDQALIAMRVTILEKDIGKK